MSWSIRNRSSTANAPSNKAPKLIVGVDYGTTYSGIAVATSGAIDAERIKSITSWPGGGSGATDGSNEHLVKVPSRIAYLAENSGKVNFPKDRDAWGYEVEPGYKSYSWTKLLLDRHAPGTPFDDATLKQQQGTIDTGILTLPAGKTAEEVVTDYLRLLYDHCISELQKETKPEIFRTTQIEFWFTFPALWSDQARTATQNAARAAGFGSRPEDSIKMVSEPEAAATYSLRSSSDMIYGLEPDTGVLICDCGGGTVDLTTYRLVTTSPRVLLAEAVSGEGGKCGSTSLDRNLHALLSRRFGRSFTSLPIEKRGTGSKFMANFETLKRNFSGTENKLFSLHLNMPELQYGDINATEYDFDDNEIVLTCEDLKDLYDPVVDQILGLVNQQVKATAKEKGPAIKTLILVGGFGSSLYLWDRLKEWCNANGEIDLLTVKRSPWAAIARGAALRGLEGGLVEKKICRRHYGTTISQKFREDIDDDEDSTYNHPFDRVKMVKHYMDWHFHKNDSIYPGTKTTISWKEYYSPGTSRRQKNIKFYYCNLDDPPAKRTNNVQVMGTVPIDLNSIDLSGCHYTKEPGRSGRTYQISIECTLLLNENDGPLDFLVKANGQVCGNTKMRFLD